MVSTNHHPLPDVHPGCPGNKFVQLKFCIRRRTVYAVLIELPDRASKHVWLSLKHVTVGPWQSSALRDPDPVTKQVWFNVCPISMPVWLYRKIQHQF